MKIEVETLEKWQYQRILGFIVGPALAGILGGTSYGTILPVSSGLNFVFNDANCNWFQVKRI